MDDKLLSIKQFRAPKSADEIRSFLGLVSFVGKFIPNLATITEPLRNLTKKNVTFNWENDQQTAFDKLKQAMSNELTSM